MDHGCIDSPLSDIAAIRAKTWLFLILSGLATGVITGHCRKGLQSLWLDKLSTIVTIVFSRIVFPEHLSRKALLGLCMITIGTLLMTLTFFL